MSVLFDARTGDGRTHGLGGRFDLVLDRVMGGRSSGQLDVEEVQGRRALRLRGAVTVEGGGGFVQMATDLPLDASGASSLRLTVLGNGETYGCHLRTSAVSRPWQSYRQTFLAPPVWTTVTLPLTGFTPHRLETPFDPRAIRRLGLIALGRTFTADLALAHLELI